MIDHYHRRMRAKVFKEYAEVASEMTREELEHAYVKAKFAHTSFAHFSSFWLDDIFDKHDNCT